MPQPPSDAALLELAAQTARNLREAIGHVVVGQQQVVDQLLITLVARGHALLVGVPGLAKTLLVASLGKALRLSFGRVQFTPDLLPADITGTDVLQERDGQRSLSFLPGPIFHNLVLGDEINRTPPKTQAALLQAMQERQVTVGNTTHLLPDPFQVFATRNPIELEGTYPLPEAQRDRFLLEIHVDYPSESEEREVALHPSSPEAVNIAPVVERNELGAIVELVPRIPITAEAVALAVALGRATRPTSPNAPPEVRDYVRYGAGPRGSQALVLCAKARAALRGEAAADVDDVRALVQATLRHRLVLSYRADADGVGELDLLDKVVRATKG
jgi:MoxR-like ATPase